MLIIHEKGRIIAAMEGVFEAPGLMVAEIPEGYEAAGVDGEGKLILAAKEKTVDEQIAVLKKAAAITAAGFSDAEAAEVPDLYPAWKAGEAVAAGDRRSHGGKLYKAVQAHATQTGWEPDKVPALWAEI